MAGDQDRGREWTQDGIAKEEARTSSIVSDKASGNSTSRSGRSQLRARTRPFDPDEEFAIESWTLWRAKRKSDSVISIREAAALSYGVDPSATNLLSEDTCPTKADYQRRVKFLVDVVNHGRDIQVVPGEIKEKRTPSQEHILFSRFMDFIILNEFWVHEKLAEIDANERKKQRRKETQQKRKQKQEPGLVSQNPENTAPDPLFDADSPTYPELLHIAVRAWQLVHNDHSINSRKTPKQQLRLFLDDKYPHLTGSAKNAITMIANWNRAGGRPKEEK